MEEPSGGPNFHKFGTDVLYEIKIDNVGDGQPHIIYQFNFNESVSNPNTFLYNTGQINNINDPTLNVKQNYTVTKVVNGVPGTPSSSFRVAPAYVGGTGHSDPNYAGPSSEPNYASLMQQAIYDLPASGGKVFAGPTDDPFYVDLGAAFDLLKIRPGAPGNNGNGKDALAGYNVHTIAIKVPKNQVTRLPAPIQGQSDSNAVIGVWSTTSRKTTTVINNDGTRTGSGAFVQVSRLGMPLVNEVVIPRGMKDKWNASQPTGDIQFLNYVTTPELAGIINSLYPVTDDIPTTNRTDLVSVFLTGVQGLNKRPQDGRTPSEQLRINLAIPPVAFANENRLGVVGGDVAGFPNGRRLKDDVVDIALKVVAGVLLGPPYSTGINAQLGDGVNKNDKVFQMTFPYVAIPHEGFANTHGSIVGIFNTGQNDVSDPKKFGLSQNYPNPFNPSTTIKFNLARNDKVTLKIFNMLGQEVRTLVNEELNAGERSVEWNGKDNNGQAAASGTYFVKLETSAGTDSKKMLLIK
jgi:hypothetical protein